jgi:hypothetical protein
LATATVVTVFDKVVAAAMTAFLNGCCNYHFLLSVRAF